jgi:hypothetical protein
MRLILSVKDVAKASATVIIPNLLLDHQQNSQRATKIRAPLAKLQTHLVKSTTSTKTDSLPFRTTRRLKRVLQVCVPRRIANYLTHLPTREITVL